MSKHTLWALLSTFSIAGAIPALYLGLTLVQSYGLTSSLLATFLGLFGPTVTCLAAGLFFLNLAEKAE